MFSAEGTFCAHGTTSHAEIQTPQLLREALRQGSGSSLSDATATEGQLQVLEVSWGCQVLETFQGNSGILLSLSLIYCWYLQLCAHSNSFEVSIPRNSTRKTIA